MHFTKRIELTMKLSTLLLKQKWHSFFKHSKSKEHLQVSLIVLSLISIAAIPFHSQVM